MTEWLYVNESFITFLDMFSSPCFMKLNLKQVYLYIYIYIFVYSVDSKLQFSLFF